MIDLKTIDAGSSDAVSGRGDWRLDAEGLEHRGTGYFIARDALGARRRDGLWEWPLHLAEKSWCAPAAFRAAFLAALDRFGIARDDLLSRSFALGVGTRAGSGAAAQAGFVALGDLVRSKPAQSVPSPSKPVERTRPAAGEPRSAARGRMAERGRVAVGARA